LVQVDLSLMHTGSESILKGRQAR